MSGKPAWRVLGSSVRGAVHTRAHRPNQDALAWLEPSAGHDALALAVADGHGSTRYMRSHRGAKLAVKLAADMLRDFGQQHPGPRRLAAVADLAIEQIPRTLVRAWQTAVRQDLDSAPFSPREEDTWAKLATDPSANNDPLRAYGATLLAALITPHYFFLLQLGDGDILVVDAAGKVGRPPLPRDPRLIANQTTSLCSPAAWRDMRTYFQPLTTRPPTMIMLATDGYANSFADETGFAATAADLLAAIRTNGHRRTANQLPRWLHATSIQGSGDDISVCLAYRGE